MTEQEKDDAFWDTVMDSDTIMFWVNEGTCIALSPRREC